jgi:hypothetical protein
MYVRINQVKIKIRTYILIPCIFQNSVFIEPVLQRGCCIIKQAQLSAVAFVCLNGLKKPHCRRQAATQQ